MNGITRSNGTGRNVVMIEIRGEKISSEHNTTLTPWPKENENWGKVAARSHS